MRRHRSEIFWKMIEHLPEPVKILDVGGTPQFWAKNASISQKKCHVTLLNVSFESPSPISKDFACSIGDARKMPQFKDQEFDVCFSNSVIEHVGTLFDQIQMAKEVRRVAKMLFIQTPNRYFPIEPHFLFPYWQFLPLTLRTLLLQNFHLGWMKRERVRLIARAEVEQIRLLSLKEFSSMFPNCTIYREMFGGITKSFIAFSSKDSR